MIEESVLERLKKIKRLADNGVAGEKAAAGKLLEQHLQKLGLTIHDLEQRERKIAFFSYSKQYERTLILHVIAKVIGWKRWEEATFYSQHKGNTKQRKVGIKLADWEVLEVEYLYAIYRKSLREFIDDSIDIALRAFIQRNDLIRTVTTDDSFEITPEEIEKSIRAEALGMGMKRVAIPRKAIAGAHI